MAFAEGTRDLFPASTSPRLEKISSTGDSLEGGFLPKEAGQSLPLSLRPAAFAGAAHSSGSLRRNPNPIWGGEGVEAVGVGEKKFKVKVYGCWEAV